MHSALIAIRNAMKIKMRGTLLGKAILVHNAENDARDATRHAEEQTPSIHPPHALLRQGQTEHAFHSLEGKRYEVHLQSEPNPFATKRETA